MVIMDDSGGLTCQYLNASEIIDVDQLLRVDGHIDGDTEICLLPMLDYDEEVGGGATMGSTGVGITATIVVADDDDELEDEDDDDIIVTTAQTRGSHSNPLLNSAGAGLKHEYIDKDLLILDGSSIVHQVSG